MSKPSLPFWQPGDSWQPPIVRLHGVDVQSREGQAILAQNAGLIRQFYLGQARAHSLGFVEQSRGVKQAAGLDLRYTNLSGQEIVDITPHPKRPPVPEPVKKPDVLLPDWLLIEFRIADGSRVRTTFSSFVSNPPWKSLDPTFGGVNFDSLGAGQWGGTNYGYSRDGRVLSAISPASGPGPNVRAVERGQAHRNTFLIDLRRIHQWPVLNFDFYGWVTSVQYAPVIDYYQRENIGLWEVINEPWAGYVVYQADGAGVGDIVDSDILPPGRFEEQYAIWNSTFETLYPGTPLYPNTKSTPDPFIFKERIYNAGDGSETALGGELYRIEFDRIGRTNIIEYYPVYVIAATPRPLEVEVRHSIFAGGDIDWQLTQWLRENDGPVTFPEAPAIPLYPYDQDYLTWEDAAFAPDFRPTQQIATADVQNLTLGSFLPVSLDPEDHYNMPYFGSYTLVQEAWSGSWSVDPSKATP